MGKKATRANRSQPSLNPTELRRQSRRFLAKATAASDEELKLHYIKNAPTLAQLAEKLDRRG